MLAEVSIIEHIAHFARHLIERYGCRALFGVLFCCGLGLPLPEDVPLIFAGVLIFRGQMNPLYAAISAWCGIIGGDCVLYLLGRKFGRDVSKIPIIGRHIDIRRIDRVEKWFEQFGVGVVAVGRMFAGIRGVMCVVAGTTRFNFLKFLIADGLAAIVSGGLFVFIGYKFAENWHRLHEIQDHIKGGMMIGLIALVIAIGGYVLWRRHARRARERALEVDKSDVPETPPRTSPADLA